MDYLDELDNSAIQALTELGGGKDININSAPPPQKPTWRRPPRYRRLPVTYLLRLEKPLSTPRDVAHALGLFRVPPLEIGTGETGPASFCRLSQSDFEALAKALENRRKPFFKIPLAIAHKYQDLPLLGRDRTLPQFMASSPVTLPDEEEEFPVPISSMAHSRPPNAFHASSTSPQPSFLG